MQLKNKIFAIVVSLLYVILYNSAFGQQAVFNKLIPPNSQSFSVVDKFAQDPNGTIWISTENGVVSYDGFQTKTFQNNPLNPNSMANSFSLSLCADKNGMIWIATLGNGLDRYNPRTNEFTHFVNDPNNPASLANDTVIAVLIDTKGILWIGTHGGLDKYDSETNTFIHYQCDENDSTSLSNNQVRTLYEDKQGTLWVGTGSPYPNDGGGPDAGGLNKLNNETGKFTRYLHDPNNPNSLYNNKVSAIFEDNTGTMWIGTWKNGVQKLDSEKGTFTQMFSDSKVFEKSARVNYSSYGLDFDYISFITQDVTGKIWIASLGTGLYCFDPANGKIITYNGTENSSSGFSDAGARSAFNSRDGILWIGTTEGNIYHIDPSIKKIQHTSITGSDVNNFYEEPNGDFWIGTQNDLIRMVKNSGITKHYTIDGYTNKSPNIQGYLVYGDKEGNIWVGTSEGLNLFDKKTEKFIAFKHDPQNSNSISSDMVICLYEDSKTNLWIGTASGLNLMDRKTANFKQFYAYPENSNQNVILSIVEDKSGKIWTGSNQAVGVNRLSPETGEFKSYLRGANVSSLLIDANEVLWVGTNKGFYKYDSKFDDFLPYVLEGAATNISVVLNIVEDKQKNLWLTTPRQIVRINPERDEISFFGEKFGVGQNEFNVLSGYVRSSGEIYFSDGPGYFSFFPEELINNLKSPEIIFTGFHLSNKKIIPGDGGPLQENLNNQKAIKLQYNQNVFSFDLAIADYADPASNRLTYFLENFDVNWRSANSERRAYYFNVPPGKYTFRVKGVNGYGAWAEKTIDIMIMPPWWKTWLAYTIYALLFIAVVFVFDRVMRRRIVQRERQRTQERELAQAKEIEKAYTELKATQTQLIQSEKMASLGELTAGIAHEIQNPLNFVNNFSEINKELISEMKEEIVKKNLDEVNLIAKNIEENEEKIIHHGKRAESIVKGMLLHSRGNSGQKELTDINALADEYLRLSYHGFRAKDKSFNADFKMEADESLPKIEVIPQDIGRVLLNLINNAFYTVNEKVKHSGNSFDPMVVVATRTNGKQVEISVKDNGNGIPEKMKEKIFQPFFTTKPTGQGTGLGLSISYDIVKAHGGELKVKSNEMEGTEFIIQIPVN